jgi:hypothetical protein
MLLLCLEIITTTYLSTIFEHSYIQFVFSFLYLYRYLSTHSISGWMQGVLESNSQCAWKSQSSKPRDSPPDRDQARLDTHGDVEMLQHPRYTQRTTSRTLEDALGGLHPVSLELYYWKAGIGEVWRST